MGHLTKVILKFEENKLRFQLLFGTPVATKEIHFTFGLSEKHVFFRPGSLFALEVWEANDYGTVNWKIYILRTVTPGEKINRLPRVLPGAEILLTVSGRKKVDKVKAWLTAMASQGHNLAMVDPDYYRAAHYSWKANLEPRDLSRPHGKVLNFLKGGSVRRT